MPDFWNSVIICAVGQFWWKSFSRNNYQMYRINTISFCLISHSAVWLVSFFLPSCLISVWSPCAWDWSRPWILAWTSEVLIIIYTKIRYLSVFHNMAADYIPRPKDGAWLVGSRFLIWNGILLWMFTEPSMEAPHFTIVPILYPVKMWKSKFCARKFTRNIFVAEWTEIISSVSCGTT